MTNAHIPSSSQNKTAIVETIRYRVAYFDTIAIWIPRYLALWERDTLDSLCGSLNYRPASKIKDSWSRRSGYKVRLVMNQPSPDALKFLRKRIGRRISPLINHVALALDFVTQTECDAQALQHYVNARWYKPYHRLEHSVSASTTTYIGFENWRSKYVTYSDLPSRHTHEPCCHLECRFQSKRNVAALGIKSIDDLLEFNLDSFWRKRLRLYEYDLEILGARWNGRHLNSAPRPLDPDKFPYDLDMRTGATLIRALNSGEIGEKTILMNLIAAARTWRRPLDRVLVPVPTADFLSDLQAVEGQ